MSRSNNIKRFVLVCLAGPLLASCAGQQQEVTADHKAASAASTDTARLESLGGDRRAIVLNAGAEPHLGAATAAAEKRHLDFTVETTGEVLANANLLTHVNAPVAGRVTEVLARVGQHVQEGQPLLHLRSQDIGQAESDLLQSEAQVRADLKRDLLQIDSEIALTGAHLKLSESTFKRISSLVEERIASRADFEAARARHEEDLLSLEALKRKRESIIALSQERLTLLTEPIKQKLRLLGVSDGEIDKVRQTREINPLVPVLAPESGIVSERLINVGELVDPSKPLFTIADFHNVWLKADIYEKDIAKVAEGQPIVLEVDSFPGERFRGQLDYVADSVNADTRTLLVRAEVPNPGLKLKPKMFARMTILVGKHEVLSIPKSAVQDAGSCKVVYVPLDRHRYEERKVEPGSESGEFVEIRSGLEPGEKVVTQGSFELRSESLKASEQ